MDLGTMLFTWLRGRLVGTDEFGNRYYVEKEARKAATSGGVSNLNPQRAVRRWVVYKGDAEASKVPAEWHVWLHRTTDEIPATNLAKRPWQKPHLPNLTGTDLAYHPPGSLLKGAHRAPTSGDYEPWRP